MKPIEITIIAILLMGLPFHSALGHFTVKEREFHDMHWKGFTDVNSVYNIDKEPSLLYLDLGDAPYYFRVNSTCRYVAPLMIFYSDNWWNLTGIPQYQEEYNCILAYNGTYIVMEKGLVMEWQNDNRQSAIYEAVKRNYTLIGNDSWQIWKRT